MIIEETENCRGLDVDVDAFYNGVLVIQETSGGDYVCVDKHQAAQLIAVLQKWIDGGELE